MHILDFIVRALIIPGALIVIVTSFVPEAIKDVKQWSTLFTQKQQKEKLPKYQPLPRPNTLTVFQNV